MNEPQRWKVSIKDGRPHAFEVCAEVIPHHRSWGWFGANKIRVEGLPFEAAKERAQIICDALNAPAQGTKLLTQLLGCLELKDWDQYRVQVRPGCGKVFWGTLADLFEQRSGYPSDVLSPTCGPAPETP